MSKKEREIEREREESEKLNACQSLTLLHITVIRRALVIFGIFFLFSIIIIFIILSGIFGFSLARGFIFLLIRKFSNLEGIAGLFCDVGDRESLCAFVVLFVHFLLHFFGEFERNFRLVLASERHDDDEKDESLEHLGSKRMDGWT
jgi:hypothetical protein